MTYSEKKSKFASLTDKRTLNYEVITLHHTILKTRRTNTFERESIK